MQFGSLERESLLLGGPYAKGADSDPMSPIRSHSSSLDQSLRLSDRPRSGSGPPSLAAQPVHPISKMHSFELYFCQACVS